ncbi:hypothetical protein IVA98_30650 [Bradyrhizobium sp. 160]|uniref:hypothetical protein n=1 Tax=Bradyrhizobium sp. 160 TaxID=2782634 RepID=UPI001FF86B04|nr:hypothetical protein [Bradyrhizobium sp. 160]MCK1627399.1 hypothetical protein [Bradyrhizobium sp. 160]
MHDEWRDGFPVRIALLERCEYNVVDERGTHWINLFDNLLNERKYYRPNLPESYRARTPEIPSINHTCGIIFSTSRADMVSTIGTALICILSSCRIGAKAFPLIGVELPGGSRPMWFSDLARALNARYPSGVGRLV